MGQLFSFGLDFTVRGLEHLTYASNNIWKTAVEAVKIADIALATARVMQNLVLGGLGIIMIIVNKVCNTALHALKITRGIVALIVAALSFYVAMKIVPYPSCADFHWYVINKLFSDL